MQLFQDLWRACTIRNASDLTLGIANTITSGSGKKQTTALRMSVMSQQRRKSLSRVSNLGGFTIKQSISFGLFYLKKLVYIDFFVYWILFGF